MLEKKISTKYCLTKTFTRQLISKTVLQKYFKEGLTQVTTVEITKLIFDGRASHDLGHTSFRSSRILFILMYLFM